MSTLPQFEYVQARDTAEAVASLDGDFNKAAIYAGGMDLLDLMKERVYTPDRLVNIKRVEALKFKKMDGDVLKLGPLVTLAEIAADEDIRRDYTALALAAGKAATPQVRAVATLGGNLCQRPRCWYLRSEDFPCLRKGGDRCFAKDGENRFHAIFTEGEPCVIVHPSATGVALLALDASLTIAGADGDREVKLSDFFLTSSENLRRENILKADEIITAVSIPASARAMRSHYIKLREKQSYDWPLADVAVAAEMDGASVKSCRIVLGSAAPVPRRATEAEAAVTGHAIDEALAAQAGELAVKGAKPLSQNEYKVNLYKVVVKRALLALAQAKAA